MPLSVDDALIGGVELSTLEEAVDPAAELALAGCDEVDEVDGLEATDDVEGAELGCELQAPRTTDRRIAPAATIGRHTLGAEFQGMVVFLGSQSSVVR